MKLVLFTYDYSLLTVVIFYDKIFSFVKFLSFHKCPYEQISLDVLSVPAESNTFVILGT